MRSSQHRAAPQKISEISESLTERINTGCAELDRVLGGGIVPGSLILIGGEPGIGKSTLSLQTALSLNKTVLYVSGEESPQQIKMRAARIGNPSDTCSILAETDLDAIFEIVSQTLPDIVFIDSVQTVQSGRVESVPGSISQVRECATMIQQYAKEKGITFILIGHINKEGAIAGPKLLEHIVDVVLQFEGDSNMIYRLLRGVKNRFGPTSEIGIFEMRETGLSEVQNPSQALIGHEDLQLSGVAICSLVEGIRPFFVEVQALVSTAAYGTPQRTANGFDLRRLNMLLAVLEKRVGFKLNAKDVFLNIVGGLRVSDPATDISVLCSVLSSSLDIAISKSMCFCGEVGLTGEIRPIARIEQRIGEAHKLGFTKMYLPKGNKSGISKQHPIELIYCSRVEEVFRPLFKQ
jgi:DNA repair protein RadA/Sms